jgi:hypothetical protein
MSQRILTLKLNTDVLPFCKCRLLVLLYIFTMSYGQSYRYWEYRLISPSIIHCTLKITERQSTDTFINTVVVFKGMVSTLFYGIGGPVLFIAQSQVQPIPERSTCSYQVNRRSYCQISISHLVRIY